MIQSVFVLLFLPFLIDALRRSSISPYNPAELLIWSALTTFIFVARLLSKGMPERISLQYFGAALNRQERSHITALTVSY